MFDRKGIVEIDKSVIDEDTLTEHAINAGAEDIDISNDSSFFVETIPKELGDVHRFLDENGVEVKTASISLIPANKIEIDDVTKASQVIRFIEALEDDDDVQNVYTNFDISEAVLEELNN